jgi:hypothetical protein
MMWPWQWLAFRCDVWRTRRSARRMVAARKKFEDLDPPVAAPDLTRSQVDEFSRKVTGKGGN